MSAVNKSGKLKFIVVAVVLLAIAGGIWWWLQQTDSDQGQLRLYGNVDIREVQMAFRQPGRIAQLHFDEGDVVQAGALMANLDAQPYQDSLAAAQAAVWLAEAELQKMQKGLRPQEIEQARAAVKQSMAVTTEAERNLRRQEKLLSTGASSQRTVDSARAARDQASAAMSSAKAALSQASEGFRVEDIAAAEARLASAQASLAQATTALADTELLAPSPGTVIARVREVGSMVSAQSTVYSVSLDTPVYVRAYISEPDLGRIAPGTTVWVSNDSSTKKYRGQIGFISPRAEFTPKTVETTELRTDLVYRLRIVIDEADADASLRQGMPVTIEVDTDSVTATSTEGI